MYNDMWTVSMVSLVHFSPREFSETGYKLEPEHEITFVFKVRALKMPKRVLSGNFNLNL